MNDVTFQDIGCTNYGSYGFKKVASDSLLFSIGKLDLNGKWRKFVEANFFDVAKCYYHCMKLDFSKPSQRRRRLTNFMKSIYDQDNMDVALIMIKAVSFLIDKDFDEEEIIGKIVKDILPNAGYFKSLKDQRYVWEIDDRKKFSRGIGKAFVITYINNNFDKDATWKYVKKYCYLKDGTWCYKNDRSKEIIEKAFLTYFKNGGIIVKEITMEKPKDFTAFVPFGKIVDEDGNDFFSLDKEAASSKHPIIKGIASTTSVDREGERASENFIGKMKKTGKGLPILDNTHMPNKAADTIGVITKTGGDSDTFEITAKLMKPEDSEGVQFILKQIDAGIKYGLSVGGRISKIFREFNDKLQREIWVVEDGELLHVAMTTQPANAETLGVAIRKILSEETDGAEQSSEALTYKHSSRLAKEAPSIAEVDKENLPDIAYPSDISRKNIFKDYPHHFVNDKGMLYLHKDMLIQAFSKALKAENVPSVVMNHLTTHLQVIGLGKKIDELKQMSEAIENLGLVKQVTGELEGELSEFVKTVASVAQLQTGVGEKKKILKNVITDVSTKLSNILKPLEKEESNES